MSDNNDFSARQNTVKALRSGPTGLAVFAALSWGGITALDHLYFEQPDTDRGPAYAAAETTLRGEFNTLQDMQEDLNALKEDLAFTSVTETEKYTDLNTRIAAAQNTLDNNTDDFITDLYTNAQLSEQDTLDYVRELDDSGLSDFAEQFRAGSAIPQDYVPLPDGGANTLHDAHAYLRECRVEKADNYNGNDDAYLTGVTTCMQSKDFDQLSMVEKPGATLGILASYPVVLIFAFFGLLGFGTLTESKKLDAWSKGQTNLLKPRTPKAKH